jgi:hypothetical protein
VAQGDHFAVGGACGAAVAVDDADMVAGMRDLGGLEGISAAPEGGAALHAVRGGYGCMRIVDGIDTALLRAHRKLLIGYSDLTALHALWAAEGLPSLHAPMPASDLIRAGREAELPADLHPERPVLLDARIRYPRGNPAEQG